MKQILPLDPVEQPGKRFEQYRVQGLGLLMIAARQCGALVVYPPPPLAAGARLDGCTPQRFTPLSMALVTRRYEAAGELIGAGAGYPPAKRPSLPEDRQTRR